MSKVVFSCGECENCLNNRHMADCLPFPCTRGYTKEDFEPYIGFSLTNIFGLKKTIIYPSYQDEPMPTPQEILADVEMTRINASTPSSVAGNNRNGDEYVIKHNGSHIKSETATTKSANKVSKIEQVFITQEYTNELISEAHKAIINLADTLGVLLVPDETGEGVPESGVDTVFDAIKDKSGYHNYRLKILIGKLKTISDMINNNL